MNFFQTIFSPCFYLIDSFRNDDNFLAILLIMGALFFLLALIIGVVLCLLIIGMLFVLVSGSVISASVLVGLQQRSVSKGFKTFFIAVSVLGSTIVSVLFFWFINSVKDWWETDVAISSGVVCGILSGWALGFLFYKAMGKLFTFLKHKYEERKSDKNLI